MSIFRILVFFVILFISRFCFACDIGEPHWDPNQCLDRGRLMLLLVQVIRCGVLMN